MEKQTELFPGLQSYTADVPVTVTNNKLIIKLQAGHISGFALLDPHTYKEKTISKEDREKDEEQRQQVTWIIKKKCSPDCCMLDAWKSSKGFEDEYWIPFRVFRKINGSLNGFWPP